jgi:hypothetical protein
MVGKKLGLPLQPMSGYGQKEEAFSIAKAKQVVDYAILLHSKNRLNTFLP